MSTFSQIVDEVVLEHLRPDLRDFIVSWLNETIREVHFDNRYSANSTVLYESNRLEDQFSPSVLPAVWPIPSIPRFQQFETGYHVERGVYFKKLHPSRTFENGYQNLDPYWYRSGSNIVFNGMNVNETANLSWFEYPRRLIYYTAATRPATYDITTDSWTYLPAYDISDDTRQTAQDLVSNWLLLRWAEVIREGCRAKIFKRQGEDVRAKMCFSQFEALKMGLIAAESAQVNE